MEGFTPNSNSTRLDRYIGLQNSKWLAENVEGVEILNEIRSLTEDEYSEVKKVEGCHLQKSELIAHTTRICHMKNSASNDNGSEHASPLQTPNQELTSTKLKQDGDSKVYPSFGSGSPDSSLKEASEYSVSSDSESEYFYSTINKDIVSPLAHGNIRQHQVAESQIQIESLKIHVGLLLQEVKMRRKKLKGSEDELVKLKSEHCNEVGEGTRHFRPKLNMLRKR